MGELGSKLFELMDVDLSQDYVITDQRNAQQLVKAHGHDLRYCHPLKTWFVWDGFRWVPDETGEVMRRAKATIKQRYKAVEFFDDVDKRKQFVKGLHRSEHHQRILAMIALAASEPGIPVLPGEFDQDPWLLCCGNGTLDLRSEELRPHRREDMITKLAPVPYDPEAKCTLWNAFLNRIMDGNQGLIKFLQRAAGYSLTASTRDQTLLLLHGSGANGKSVFLTTLQAALGSYAAQAAPDMLLAKKGERHPTEIADLLGIRFCVAIETDEGRRLAESLVKQLTGGDKIKARRMRQDFFEFEPSHKLWLSTNHRPVIRGSDHAIWRRIKLVPFAVTIPESERDSRLAEKLRDELPGILAWAVRGCIAWQWEGLGEPDEVKDATEHYKAEMDLMAEFLDECSMINPFAKAPVKSLYQSYVSWCQDYGEHPLSQRGFREQMIQRGFNTQKSTGGQMFWMGIGIRVEKVEHGGLKTV